MSIRKLSAKFDITEKQGVRGDFGAPCQPGVSAYGTHCASRDGRIYPPITMQTCS